MIGQRKERTALAGLTTNRSNPLVVNAAMHVLELFSLFVFWSLFVLWNMEIGI